MCGVAEGMRAGECAGGGHWLSHGKRTSFPQRDWDGRGSMWDVGVGELQLILGQKVESLVGPINNGRLNNWL